MLRFLRGPQRRSFELVRAARIFVELIRGFRALHFVGPCVTVFGSARFAEDHPYYRLGREVGALLARAGFTVMTGGGPGIMEAANRGAKEGGRVLDRLQHRAAARAAAEPLPRPLDHLPAFLRPQGHRSPVGAETPAFTPWEERPVCGRRLRVCEISTSRPRAMPPIRPPTTRCGTRSIGSACCRMPWPTACAAC